jgi:hypothetical protein
MLANLSIEVEITGGADIHQAIQDAVSLANRLTLCVKIAPNGIGMMICPGDDPDQLILEWESEVAAA